jgi:hypothetical protein
MKADFKADENPIESTTKTIRLFGIKVWTKTHYYPKAKEFDIFFKI